MIVLYDNREFDIDLLGNELASKLVGRSLRELENEDFLVFPPSIAKSDTTIFSAINGKTTTGNLVGFLSDGKQNVVIKSRFSEYADDDYFLTYMLEKVLNYSIIDSFQGSSEKKPYYNLLFLLFPYYMNIAMQKGPYKEYVKRNYNNADFRGRINISKQLKRNIPFSGQIAYQVSELSYDNDLMQLVRHALEKVSERLSNLINSKVETRKNVSLIRQATPSYSKVQIMSVLQKNIRNEIRHDYFSEYISLQKLCIQILKENGVGDSNKKFYGIIVDIAWLWEEYIATITKWKHYGMERELETLYLFRDSRNHHRYPDFIVENIPIDTKYKFELDTVNDYNQLITYLHIINKSQSSTMQAGFLQPTTSYDQTWQQLGTLEGLGGNLFTYKFYVPQQVDSYENFVRNIRKVEKQLKDYFAD